MPIILPPPDDGGLTFLELQDTVLANSFNASRYRDLIKRWLDDGVTETCRRLKLFEGAEILGVDATTGEVTQAARPFFQVHELWTASAASGSGLEAVRRAADRQLTRLTGGGAPSLGRTGTEACHYSVSRTSSADRLPQVRLTIHPAGAASVAVVGLQRPAAMVDDADTSGLGADLDDALVAFAKHRCFRNEDDVQMAQFWRAEFLAGITNAAEAVDSDDGPIVTPGTWDE